MAQTMTCSHGHRWESDGANPTAASCPECGEAAAPGPTRADGGDATPAPGVTWPEPPRPPAPATGTPVFPGYEILGELGRGGMGVVYKARHLALNRVVALKMLTAGAHAGPDLLARFRREGESLARLTHPHIVQIHEVGWLDSHGPYLVLEHVEGGSLAQKLARTPQPPRYAAEVVAVLARAVHFAHERGVLHRDLKPSNVLLTADGTPKVTDFGLARFLEAEATASPDRPTPTGAVLGTPGYMAPEQAGGVTRSPTAAMDVYALGAILYEMLTGRPPFLAEGPMETMLLALTEDPVPPRRLQSKAPRDLETICLHCLRKNPRQRYPSAAALADDLQRFLDGKPIRVRPAGAVERVVKWARRRPAVAALLGVSVAAVLAGLGLAGWYQAQLYRKNADLTRALDEARRQQRFNNGWAATAVDALGDYGDLTDDLVAPLPESDEARRALLEGRLRFFREFERLAEDDPLVRLRKAAGLFQAARIRQKLGEDDAAEKEFNDAIRLYEQAAPDEAAAPETRYELGRACVRLGMLLAARGRWDEAGRPYDRGVGLLQGLIDEGRDDPRFRAALAQAYRARAVRRGAEKQWSDAFDDMRRAVDLAKGLAAEDDDDGQYQALLAVTYAARCGLYRCEGEPGRGREDADAAVALFGKVGPDLRAEEGIRNALATAHFHRGLALIAVEKRRAFADFAAAWSIWDRLRRAHPAAPDYRFRTAEARGEMGLVGNPADPAEAEIDLHEADELFSGVDQPMIDGLDCRAERDTYRYHLALALHKAGKYDEAEPLLRDLVGRLPDDPAVRTLLGDVLCARGHAAATAANIVGSLRSVGLTVGPNPLGAYQGYVGQLHAAQAEVWAAIGRFDEAIDRQAEAAKVGQGRLDAGSLREIAQSRLHAVSGLERALFINYLLAGLPGAIRVPAGYARARDEYRRAAEIRAELAEAWPSLETEGDAAANYRQAAADAFHGFLADYGTDDLPARKAEREQADAVLTVRLLRKAVAAGYRDAAGLRRSPEATAILGDADPLLRAPREDFRALLSEMEGKADP